MDIGGLPSQGQLYSGYFSPATHSFGHMGIPPAGLSPPLSGVSALPLHPSSSPAAYGSDMPAASYDAPHKWQEVGGMQPPTWGYGSSLPQHLPSNLGPHAVRPQPTAMPQIAPSLRARQLTLSQQVLQNQGWRAAASGRSSGSSESSSPMHAVGSLELGEGATTAAAVFAVAANAEANEALDDAAAAGTALAAAGSLDDNWRVDPGALFRSGSAGALGAGGCGSSGLAGSISAPGSARCASGNVARMIPGSSSSIWSFQPTDGGGVKPVGLGLGTSPVARVLFPQGMGPQAGDVEAGSSMAFVGGCPPDLAGSMPASSLPRHSGFATAQLLPTEGELLMAMATAEGQVGEG